MSEKTKLATAVAEVLPVLTKDAESGLPLTTLPTVTPEAEVAAEVKSEAQVYAEHRVFIHKQAETVIAACDDLQATETKVRLRWWGSLLGIASKCAPGNGQQFSREYDMVRQEVLDILGKRDGDSKFTPSGKAESLAAKWAELEKARSGYSTLANYASQTKFWVEKVKASVDPDQSPESFGMTVRNFYADTKAAEKAAAANTGEKLGTTGSKDEASGSTVASSMVRQEINVKGQDGKYRTETVNFPASITTALVRLNKQIAHALFEKCPPADIVAAIQTAHDLIGHEDESEGSDEAAE